MMRLLVGGLAAALAAASIAARPQTPGTGSISGFVRDTDGGVIPGATVTVAAPGLDRTTSTNSSGRYRVADLVSGKYHVEIKLRGWITEARDVAVSEGQDADFSVTMRLDIAMWNMGERPDAPNSVEKFVERMTGANAVECGRHKGLAEEAALRQSLDCGLAASRDRKAFHTIRQYGGVDSWIGEGLLGTSDGTVFIFHYDGSPCGGPGCEPRFEVSRCLQPAVALDSNGSGSRVRFVCR